MPAPHIPPPALVMQIYARACLSGDILLGFQCHSRTDSLYCVLFLYSFYLTLQLLPYVIA